MTKKRYIFLLVLVIHIIFMSGHIYSPDEEILFRTTQSIAEDFSISIEAIEAGFGTKTGINNRQFPQYGIGQPALAVPFYFMGSALSRVFESVAINPTKMQKLDYSVSYMDYSFPPAEEIRRGGFRRLAVSLFNSLIAAISSLLILVFLKEAGYSEITSAMSALLYSFATVAFVHHRTFFSEPLAALTILAAFYFLYKGFQTFPGKKSRNVFMILAGLSAGYSALTRMDSVLLISGLGIYFLLKTFKVFKKENDMPGNIVSDIICFGFPFFLLGIFLLYLNYCKFGGMFATGYDDQPEGIQFSTPLLAGAFGFLFSAGKGMFFFSPALILIFWGIKQFFKREKELALGITISIVIFFIAMAKWQNWAGGWCWGPRHIFQIHILLILFAASALESFKHQNRRLLFTAFFISGIFVNILGSSVNFIDYYYEAFRTPREQPSAFALYSPDEYAIIERAYSIITLDEKGKALNQVTPNYLPAPINDSIYIPQNSQWKWNFILLKQGQHDFFWIKLLSGNLLIPAAYK